MDILNLQGLRLLESVGNQYDYKFSDECILTILNEGEFYEVM